MKSSLLFGLLFSIAACSGLPCTGEPGQDWVQGEVTATFKAMIDKDAASRAVRSDGFAIRDFIEGASLRAWVEVPIGQECQSASTLRGNSAVESVTLSYLLHP